MLLDYQCRIAVNRSGVPVPRGAIVVQDYPRLSFIALALVSCSKPTEPAKDPAKALPAKSAPGRPKPLDGWGPFKFGMAFDDAFTAQPGIRWDGESFQKCRDEMPLKGCSLAPNVEDSYVPLTAGVALLPSLSFNQDGKLVTIDMTKILRGNIAPRQCERVHGQLLDYLDAEWGPGKASGHDPKNAVKRTTPKGRTFYHTAGSGPVFVFDVEDFSVRPDGRKITIISHYTAKSEYSPADCWVSIYFDAPKSLERPQIEFPAVDEATENKSEGETE